VDFVHGKILVTILGQSLLLSTSVLNDIVLHTVFQMTPDHDFFLDYHPEHHNIIIGAGFSGMYVT